MKILIHAGIHRTGTSTLQGFLSENRALLAAKGVFYPGEARNHQPLAWALKRGDAGVDDILALAESAGGCDRMVLSAEDFCIHTDLSWLRALAGRFETRAVFYLRRQDHWLMSWYNQHIKWPFEKKKSRMGKTEFLSTIADFHWIDFDRLLDRWTGVLGNANVAAAVVENGQVENVVEDFSRRIGLEDGEVSFDAERRNDSLPVHMLEVARQLGLAELPPQARVRLIRALRVGLADKKQPARTVFSPDERISVLKRFETSNRAVAKRWFGRGELFLEAPPAPGEPFYAAPDLSREEWMRDWVVPVIHQLLRKP